jgi:aminoglycoside phosphotransferase (APT) family kinase protein
MTTTDVVDTPEQARQLEREPLIVCQPLAEFLDSAGLGSAPIVATPIGAGHSNITYAIESGAARLVLRRPPRGPLAPSTHDVLREARLLKVLGRAGVRVPEVLAVCDDPLVIGAPFYVMRFIDGFVLDRALPLELTISGTGQRIGEQLVDALAELHAVDFRLPDLASFGRQSGYLERQLLRFSRLLADNATRALPELERVGSWLSDNLPVTAETTVVHGDYRLGNVIFLAEPGPRIAALLDWEMATLGDPLADLGYLTAMWAEPDDPPDPMLDLSAVTRLDGFPSRNELVARYAYQTGRDVSNLHWYQALALWKAAVFLECSFARYVAGTTDDSYFASLDDGVPRLARRAMRQLESQPH